MTAESFRGMERMTPRERPAGKGKPRHGFDANNTESDGRKETKSLEMGTLVWHNVEHCNGCRRHSVGVTPWVLCPLATASYGKTRD
jgi:hypothetical protein